MPKLSKYQESLRKNDKVQSLLFDKNMYTLEDVCPIVKFLGYNCFYIDETDKKYRVRQFNPADSRRHARFYTKNSRKFPGLEFVIQTR